MAFPQIEWVYLQVPWVGMAGGSDGGVPATMMMMRTAQRTLTPRGRRRRIPRDGARLGSRH